MNYEVGIKNGYTLIHNSYFIIQFCVHKRYQHEQVKK